MSADPHKLDAGKPMWDLLPWREIEEVVKVLTFGQKKYGGSPWVNLHKVENARSRYFAAAHRHINSWWNGEIRDSETGCHHLSHAICCLLFQMWMDRNQDL